MILQSCEPGLKYVDAKWIDSLTQCASRITQPCLTKGHLAIARGQLFSRDRKRRDCEIRLKKPAEH